MMGASMMLENHTVASQSGLAWATTTHTRTLVERGPARVLIVDGDPGARAIVGGYLERYALQTCFALGRHEATTLIGSFAPSILVLHLGLTPKMGLEFLRAIRLRSHVPVILVSQDRSEEADAVVGLELGADDFLSEPFSLRELAARIHAVLRRSQAELAEIQRKAGAQCCRFGGWQLDRRSRRLVDSRNRTVMLTKGEYALLIAFIEAPQRPLTRDYLLGATRIHEDVWDRSIDITVWRLRRKLEVDPRTPVIIRTERGVGYTFTLSVDCTSIAPT
jgi:two-component system OmpR family response regulator